MFFDLSSHKVFVVALIVAVILGSAIIFAIFDQTFHLVSNAATMMGRMQSELVYLLVYKMPLGNVAAAAQTTGTARSVPVLLYHGESQNSELQYGNFVDQMRTLKERGWHTITMQQFEDFMQGKGTVPERSFLLTFDDGRKDTYYPVDPVLQDLGFTAVMFVITGQSLPEQPINSHFYLNQDELSTMVRSGRWDIESHGDADHSWYHVQSTTDLTQTAATTLGHFMSNKFWSQPDSAFETDQEFANRIGNDLTTAKTKLQNTFKITVNAYAFPFNDYGQDTINFPGARPIVARVVPAVYRYAFYQTSPDDGDSFNYPNADQWMIKRIEPDPSWSGQQLLEALAGGGEKDLPYQSDIFGQEWAGTWGSVTTNGSLDLAATQNTGGASAFLNGSALWTDYQFTANVDRTSGHSLSLIARNQNGTDYVACAFASDYVGLERHTSTGPIPVAETSIGVPAKGSLGIAVAGDRVQCLVNGHVVEEATIPQVSAQGGIGLLVWDPTIGIARASISTISVAPLSTSPSSATR